MAQFNGIVPFKNILPLLSNNSSISYNDISPLATPPEVIKHLLKKQDGGEALAILFSSIMTAENFLKEPTLTDWASNISLILCDKLLAKELSITANKILKNAFTRSQSALKESTSNNNAKRKHDTLEPSIAITVERDTKKLKENLSSSNIVPPVSTEESLIDRAKKASTNIRKILNPEITVSDQELFKLCFFIEQDLPKLVQEKNLTYFRKETTSLPLTLEWLPTEKKALIHVKTHFNAPSARGGSKRKTISVLYDTTCPRIVANIATLKSELSSDEGSQKKRAQEIELHKELTGLPGIVSLLYGEMRQHKTVPHTTQKLLFEEYNQGALQPKHKTTLSDEQKISIVYDALQGLATMHEHDIAHRDTDDGNILIHIEDQKAKATLTDFGSSKRKSAEPLLFTAYKSKDLTWLATTLHASLIDMSNEVHTRPHVIQRKETLYALKRPLTKIERCEQILLDIATGESPSQSASEWKLLFEPLIQ